MSSAASPGGCDARPHISAFVCAAAVQNQYMLILLCSLFGLRVHPHLNLHLNLPFAAVCVVAAAQPDLASPGASLEPRFSLADTQCNRHSEASEQSGGCSNQFHNILQSLVHQGPQHARRLLRRSLTISTPRAAGTGVQQLPISRVRSGKHSRQSTQTVQQTCYTVLIFCAEAASSVAE